MSNFDFNKAIQGEPIYCNGKLVEDISWRVARNEFELNLFIAGNPEVDDMSGMVYFDKNGCIKNTIGCTFPENKFNLTTDPPKKKVKKTVNVYQSKMHKNVLDAAFAKGGILLGNDWELLFTHEIEVGE